MARYFFCLRKNNRVCIEFDIPGEMKESDQGCKWGIAYHSVIRFGTAELLYDGDGKGKSLEILMAHYSDQEFSFPDDIITKTAVIKVVIAQLTEKHG